MLGADDSKSNFVETGCSIMFNFYGSLVKNQKNAHSSEATRCSNKRYNTSAILHIRKMHVLFSVSSAVTGVFGVNVALLHSNEVSNIRTATVEKRK